MLFALLAACSTTPTTDSPGTAALDSQNWLRGTFVDAYDVRVVDVELELISEPAQTFGYETVVRYMSDESVVAFGFDAPAIPVPDESNPFPEPVEPTIEGVDVDDVGVLELEWRFVDEAQTSIEGTFAVSFVVDGELFDVDGSFSGPLTR